MPSQRSWPEGHTNSLLDYLDEGGKSLVTAGRQRKAGYQRLRKHLNKSCTPRPRPAYTIDDIKEHCQYIVRTYSNVVGPNLKGLFAEGRDYLQSPLVLNDEDSEPETGEDEISQTASPCLLREPTIFEVSISPSRTLRSSSKNLQTVEDTESLAGIHKRQKLDTKDEVIEGEDVLPQEYTPPSLEWQELFNLRSKKNRVPFQDIQPGMFQLERNAQKAVDVYLKGGRVNILPRPDFEYIKRNYPTLDNILQEAVSSEQQDKRSFSNVMLLRAIIGWAVFKLVLEDPFPTFGTECGPIWDELKEILDERGGTAFLPYFENLRLDIQFRLSQKPEFLNETLPTRAGELAQRLADILEPIFFKCSDTGEYSLLSLKREPRTMSREFMPKLKEAFLDALDLVVKLRQREHPTEFFWPEFNATFDEKYMQTESNGTKEDFEGKKVLLTLVPAALGRIVNNKERTETELDVYYKALVILDMDPSL